MECGSCSCTIATHAHGSGESHSTMQSTHPATQPQQGEPHGCRCVAPSNTPPASKRCPTRCATRAVPGRASASAPPPAAGAAYVHGRFTSSALRSDTSRCRRAAFHSATASAVPMTADVIAVLIAVNVVANCDSMLDRVVAVPWESSWIAAIDCCDSSASSSAWTHH